jgi:hypothetical protein
MPIKFGVRPQPLADSQAPQVSGLPSLCCLPLWPNMGRRRPRSSGQVVVTTTSSKNTQGRRAMAPIGGDLRVCGGRVFERFGEMEALAGLVTKLEFSNRTG